MDGSATCSIKLLSKSYCQNMSVLNTWNTLPRNNRRVLHGRLEILLVELQGNSSLYNLEHHHVGTTHAAVASATHRFDLLTVTALLRPELRHEIPVVRPSLREKTSFTSLSIS